MNSFSESDLEGGLSSRLFHAKYRYLNGLRAVDYSDLADTMEIE